MGKFLAIFKREYLERVRTKWFLIGTVLAPVFFGAISILPAIMASKTKPSSDIANIAILDATGTDLGRRVARSIGDSTGRIVRVVSPPELARAETTATHDVMQRRTRGYLVLDQLTLAGEKARYGGRNASSMMDVNRLTQAVRQSVLSHRLEAEGLDPAKITALTSIRLDFSADQITDKGRGGSGVAAIIFGYIIAFLLYMLIAIYGQVILRGVMEEKTTRVAEVVVSSAPTDTLLYGKVIGVGSVVLTQQIIWGISTFLIWKARAPIMAKFGAAAPSFSLPHISLGSGLVLLLLFLLGFFFYAALFAAVGSMVNSQEDVQQASMPVMLLLISSIMFIAPILQNPMSGLAKTMSRLPFSAPIIMPLRMSAVEVSTMELTLTLLGLALSCAAAVWVASRIYRVGMLMYGKRPTVKELVRWVRYSY